MLTSFSVKNYMGFPELITWDLAHPRDYSFNTHLIKGGVVKNGIIYGINGSGKSSLGKALFDIVSSIGGGRPVNYSQVVYQGAPNELMDFKYEFKFDEVGSLTYSYSKDRQGSLVKETLLHDEKVIFSKDGGKINICDEFPLD